jgi:hypothetical protein
MKKLSELPVVTHEHFGMGFVLGERVADIGPVRDVFFVDEKVRAVLPGYLTDAVKPDAAPKTLRAAYSAYRKAHRKHRTKSSTRPETEHDETAADDADEIICEMVVAD